MWWRGEIMNGWNIRNQWLICGVTIIIVVVVAVVFNGEKIRGVETSQIGFYQHWVIVLVYLTSCAWRRLGYIEHSLEHKMVGGLWVYIVRFFLCLATCWQKKKIQKKKKKKSFLLSSVWNTNVSHDIDWRSRREYTIRSFAFHSCLLQLYRSKCLSDKV